MNQNCRLLTLFLGKDRICVSLHRALSLNFKQRDICRVWQLGTSDTLSSVQEKVSNAIKDSSSRETLLTLGVIVQMHCVFCILQGHFYFQHSLQSIQKSQNWYIVTRKHHILGKCYGSQILFIYPFCLGTSNKMNL